MKILSWNLNHRIQKKIIPDEVLFVINEISPGLLVLNEYVDGEERLSFKRGLNEIGFLYISVSQTFNRQNQILIASRMEHKKGDLTPPVYDEASISNFLHVLLPSLCIEIVGLRVPAYRRSDDLNAYGSYLIDIIRTTISRPILFIGDFNCAPSVYNTLGAKYLNVLREENWQLPIPHGNWSHISYNGQRHSRLDYVLGSPEVDIISGIYVSELDSYIIAGPQDQNPLSDHAILLCDLNGNTLSHTKKSSI